MAAGAIAVAEKLASLAEHAPAGGLFHDANIGIVAGIEIETFGGMAGFTIKLRNDNVTYEVVVKRPE